MEIEKVRNTETRDRKNKQLNVKISNEDFNFLKTNKLSVTKITNEAIKELKLQIKDKKK